MTERFSNTRSLTATTMRAQFVRAADWLSIVRVTTCMGVTAETVIGAHLGAVTNSHPNLSVLWVALSMTCIMAAANLVNDIVDRELDKIEKPQRPLPAGRIQVRSARAAAVAAIIVAVGSSALVGGLQISAALVLLVLATTYSTTIKRRIPIGANIVVALVSSAPIVLGAMAVGSVTPSCLVATSAVFLFVVGYDGLKTALDVHGDYEMGIATMATRFGTEFAVGLSRLALAGTY